MKLEIVSVHNHGDFDKEYVLLKALEDCDIGRYVLSDSTYLKGGQVSNLLRHICWLPTKEINEGDLVSVWTKAGSNVSTTTDKGTPIHRIFWGLKTAVWNDTGDCAVLLELNTWQLFKARG